MVWYLVKHRNKFTVFHFFSLQLVMSYKGVFKFDILLKNPTIITARKPA